MGKQAYQSSMKTAFNLSLVFSLGTDKVKNKDRKYGFDGLQVVLDNLQTAIEINFEPLMSNPLFGRIWAIAGRLIFEKTIAISCYTFANRGTWRYAWITR